MKSLKAKIRKEKDLSYSGGYQDTRGLKISSQKKKKIVQRIDS